MPNRMVTNIVAAIVLAVTAFITSREAGAAVVDPISINDSVAIFGIGGYYTLDSNTHAFSASETIVAVQFLNQVLSYDDPLVGNTLTVSGFFSGIAIDPLANLDTTGVFSAVTTSIYFGGQLAYSEVITTAQFSAIYLGPDTAVADWVGAGTETFLNPSLISLSPFLSLYATFHDTSVPETDTGWVYCPNYGAGGVVTESHCGNTATKGGKLAAAPEPPTLYGTVLIILALMVVPPIRRVRKRSSSA